MNRLKIFGGFLWFIIVTGLVCLVSSGVIAAIEPQSIEGTPGVAVERAVVNFSELARQKTARPTAPHSIHLHLRKMASTNQNATTAPASENVTRSPMQAGRRTASPGSSTNFLALGDDNTIIPPDTHGTVGTNHVMTTLNSQVQIQNRSGTVLSTVTLNSFWAPVGGAPDCFDPRVLYDSFNNRWIFSAVADAAKNTSAILIGVSQTSNPTGNWNLYRIKADSSSAAWADYPSVGFNKDWIVVTANMFLISNDSLQNVNLYIFSKTNLYANGSGNYRLFQDTSGQGFTIVPSQTYDNSLATEYMIEDWDSTQGQLRISTITGPVGAEILTLGTAFPAGPNSWSYSATNTFLPQLGTSQKLDQGDSRILDCVYRNGKIWAAHTVLLPSVNPTRCAAQWWQINTNGAVLQVGRIDDPSGTTSYAYPTIGVNKNDDAMIGYSRFSATQYVSANYAFRFATDPLSTLRADTVFKAGLGAYYKTLGAANDPNRWGDYSATVVDPVDDITLWTIQEYAAAPVGSITNNSGRWGTWWGKLDAVANMVISNATLMAEGCSPTNGVIDPAETVTVNLALRNSGWAAVTNLVATLQSANGVTSPSGPQTYGAIAAGSTVVRPFTFTASGSCGGTILFILSLQDGAASLGTVTNTFQLGVQLVPLSENFDGVTAPTLPAGWSVTGSSNWITVANSSDSAPNSVFAPDLAIVSDLKLMSPSFAISTTNAQLTFRHSYDFEVSSSTAGYDGGVLEISTNNDTTYIDIISAGGSFVANGYNRTNESGFQNPLSGRAEWSGNSGGFITTIVNLPASASGHQNKLRWRCGTDQDTGAGGWYIDSITLADGYSCNSCLAMPTILNPKASGTNITFSFQTVAAQNYVVEYKNSLAISNWTSLQTNLGDGALKSVTNTPPAQRYYRIRSP